MVQDRKHQALGKVSRSAKEETLQCSKINLFLETSIFHVMIFSVSDQKYLHSQEDSKNLGWAMALGLLAIPYMTQQ